MFRQHSSERSIAAIVRKSSTHIVAGCTVTMCAVWSHVDAGAARVAFGVGHDDW